MATTAHASHSRGPSVTRLECDINPNFAFPVPHTRSQSLLPGPSSTFPFPPANSPVHSYAYPPRRGSVPPTGNGPLASASLNTTRPKSSSASSTLSPPKSSTEGSPISSPATSPGELNAARARGPPTPYYPGGIRPGGRTIAGGTTPTIVNASVSGAAGLREGHQRTGSEMIGGPPLLMLKKEDHVLGTTTERARPIVPLPPSGVRRGHAHRRSGAISSGDVWSLMSQSAPSLPLACTAGPGNQGASNGTLDVQPKGSVGSSPVLSRSAPVSPGFTGRSHSDVKLAAVSNTLF